MIELNENASYKEIVAKVNEIVNWINMHNEVEIQELKSENRAIEIAARTNESVIRCFGGNNVIQ